MQTIQSSPMNTRQFSLPGYILCFMAAVVMFVTGCGDEETILEAVENVKAPDGVLPKEGPKFCFDQRPPAQFACRTDTSCIEYLPEYQTPEAELGAECENDGGQLVKHCAVDDTRIVGACVVNGTLNVAYSDAAEAQKDCEQDAFEWVACPIAETP